MSDPNMFNPLGLRRERSQPAPEPFGAFFQAHPRITVEMRECVGRVTFAHSLRVLCPVIYTGTWTEVTPLGIVLVDEDGGRARVLPWPNILAVHEAAPKEDT